MSSDDTINHLEKEILYLKIKVEALVDLLTSVVIRQPIKDYESYQLMSNADIISKEAEIKNRDDIQRLFLEIGRHSLTDQAELDELYNLADKSSSESFTDGAKSLLKQWLDEAMSLDR